jgi:hydroxypyruvate isomerase
MHLTRRSTLAALAGGAAACFAPLAVRVQAQNEQAPFRVHNNRIRQSVMGWCFKPMTAEQLARHCKDIGIVGIEGISAADYPKVKDIGLSISLVGSHGFQRGPCDPANRDFCIEKLRNGIDLAAEVGCPSVITFTGMRVEDLDDDAMSRNCIDVWKQVIGHAESKKINLCLEHLNTRDDTHPMKGHPGYFGDDVDHCVKLIEQVGSPRMKLLFDVYHVQIMNGDVIRRIRQHKDVIGHYHTAGNPGRRELDENQEINYPAVMRAIAETGYDGFVAQEFIPTWDDKVAALRHAVKLCDV